MLWGRLLHKFKCSHDGVQIVFRMCYGCFLYDYTIIEWDILVNNSRSRLHVISEKTVCCSVRIFSERPQDRITAVSW